MHGRYGVDGAQLGVCTVQAAAHPTDKCGPTGLPLTPNSVRIYGRSQRFLALRHPHLCEHVGTEVGSAERVYLVSEHHGRHAGLHLHPQPLMPFEDVARTLYQLASALAYLHSNDVVARTICLENVRLTLANDVKLRNYVMFTATDCGAATTFPIGSPAYLSPQILTANPAQPRSGNPKDDIWALGIVALELLTGHRIFQHTIASGTAPTDAGPVCVLDALFGCITALSDDAPYSPDGHCDSASKRSFLRRFQAADFVTYARSLDAAPEPLLDLVYACLAPRSAHRPSSDEVLDMPCFFAFVRQAPAAAYPELGSGSAALDWQRVRAELDATGSVSATANGVLKNEHGNDDNDRPTHVPAAAHLTLEQLAGAMEADPLFGRPLREVYYLWRLTNTNLERHLQGEEAHAEPSINRLPRLVRVGLPEIGRRRDFSAAHDGSTRAIAVERLTSRLLEAEVDPYPIVLPLEGLTPSDAEDDTENQPILVRERSVAYQYRRVLMFERLLRGHPFSRPYILQEAAKDIPPLLRAQVWAVLLEVPPNVAEQYDAIDKVSEDSTDRQLDVDIPRCHQYDLLLSSPDGHTKLKRVLKAWIRANPALVYWQGLDSLTAPFVCLNFNDEAMAFGCLCNFVNRYLPSLFLKNNTEALHEFLAVFWHLVSYHDPELWAHLEDLMFKPDLFAIPWFLTCFAHVFSLDKIYHLWDALLLSSSTMILCIAVAILRQLRETLLQYDFNECILHFGDAPDVDIHTTIEEARQLYDKTPPSCSARKAATSPHDRQTPEHVVLSLQDLRMNSSPAISLHDFERFYLHPERRTPIPRRQSQVLAIDIRSAVDFDRAHLASSCFNLPADEYFQRGQLHPEALALVKRLCSFDRHVVVVGMPEREQESYEVARALVTGRVAHVSVLSVGVPGLARHGLLTEQGPDAFRTKLESNLAAVAAANSDSGDSRSGRGSRGGLLMRRSVSGSLDA